MANKAKLFTLVIVEQAQVITHLEIILDRLVIVECLRFQLVLNVVVHVDFGEVCRCECRKFPCVIRIRRTL